MKKYLLLVGAVVFLVVSSMSVSAVSDGTNDVWHQSWTGTGYAWEAYSGSKPNIDITDVSYSIQGTTATVTMTTSADMTTNSENVVYTAHLKSSDDSYYMLFYSNGQGAIMGMGNFQGYASQIENPISGNTFSASFEVSDPNLDYTVVAFNVEHSDIDNDQGEAWWDYAPNSEAPYYSAGAGEEDTDTGNDDSGTPGFELLVLLAALGISFIILRRKR